MYAMVERGTAVPPSQQVADILRARITSGVYEPGTLLPSIVRLSQEFEVATRTVQKALTILKDEGLIASHPGYGTYVKPLNATDKDRTT